MQKLLKAACLILSAIIFLLYMPLPSATAEENAVLYLPAQLREIGEGAFYRNYSLNTVILSEGTEVIGPLAFACGSLRSITLPRSLREIDPTAFYDCWYVTAKVYQNSVAEAYCREYHIPFEVIRLPLTEIRLPQETVLMATYTKFTPPIMFVPENSGWTAQDLVWTTENKDVCRISSQEPGVLYTQAPGETVITASTPDGSFTASCRLAVTPDGQEMTSLTERISRVITVAHSQIGYKAKATPDQLEDFTANAGANYYNKYADYFDRKAPRFYNGEKNGVPWCDIFVDWCFVQAYGLKEAQRMTFQSDKCAGASCTFSYRYYKEHNRVGTEPRVGAQVFYSVTGDSLFHTGLVVHVDDQCICTIEGNWNYDVSFRVVSLQHSTIYGFGYPLYE